MFAPIIAVVVVIGLGSRRYGSLLPGLLAAHAGDTLWALMVFLGFGLLFPRLPTLRTALLAIAFSYAIELSQLYHAPWIDWIRSTAVGGLVLGYGFLWSDIACYAVGIGLGVASEVLLLRDPGREPPAPGISARRQAP